MVSSGTGTRWARNFLDDQLDDDDGDLPDGLEPMRGG